MVNIQLCFPMFLKPGDYKSYCGLACEYEEWKLPRFPCLQTIQRISSKAGKQVLTACKFKRSLVTDAAQ